MSPKKSVNVATYSSSCVTLVRAKAIIFICAFNVNSHFERTGRI
jgi:hypothetical protein